MKRICTLLLILVVASTSAQNSKTKKADDLYNALAYADAVVAYQKLLKQGEGSRYVFEQLANSYYYINNTKKAETYYKRVAKARKVKPETVYNYAQTLKANGKISDYQTWMSKFADMNPADSRAQEFKKNPNYVSQMLDGFPGFEAINIEDINTEYSEFGGISKGKNFYFSSARNTQRKKYRWNEEPFLDIYKAEHVGNTVKNAQLLEGDVNTKFHEGNVAFSADGKRMYFDRNDYFNGKYGKNEEGVNQINLYYSEWVDGGWKGVFEVPVNSNDYSSGHPAMSPDGKTLYFTSDRPGGKGDSDIYMIAVNEDGTFGTPQAVGGNVNTEGKEVFPFIDVNGNLYFSSDGHMGLGRLDVFYARAEGTAFADPVNLGKGANSEADDFAFSWDPNTEKGYVSSNRKGGKGSDDIYTVNAIEPPCDVNIDVTVINEYTDEPIFGAMVNLFDNDDTRLDTKTSNEAGNTKVTGDCNKDLMVQAAMRGFEGNGVAVSAMEGGETTTVIKLKPIEAIIVDDKIVLEPILFDTNKSEIKPKAALELDRLVAIMKKYPKMIIKVESHTDNVGNADYNRELSDKRAKSTVAYVISQGVEEARISGEGFGEDRPAVDCGANCSDADLQKNRRSDFIIVERE